jgi:putative ABC transport system substrate-binding protein
MRRRNLIFGLFAVATTSGARAEQSKKVHRIAIVLPSIPVTEMTETSGEPFFQGLFNELRRLGYVEGRSLLIERYSGEGRAAHYPDLAKDVVRRNPDVIIIGTTNLTLDFKAATTTIPIIGAFARPVETGIVASLARPGANITGATVDVGGEQWGKRFQLLQQVAPQATRLGGLESRAVREQWEAFERELVQRVGRDLVQDLCVLRRVTIGPRGSPCRRQPIRRLPLESLQAARRAACSSRAMLAISPVCRS